MSLRGARTAAMLVTRRAILLAVLALSPAGAAAAQHSPAPTGPVLDDRDRWVAPRWVGDVTFVAVNALVGGLTAGLTQRVRGGDFLDAFVGGAGGGAVAYAGRRLAVQRFDGAGLAGRQLSALGVSMARNAGEGRPSLERLMFPLGPLHLHVDRSSGVRVRPKVHLLGLAQAGRLALYEETELDWRLSLSAGAPVFRAPGRTLRFEGEHAAGLVVHGSIVLGESREINDARLFAHERVHVLQSDFAFLTLSDPVEAWLVDAVAPARVLYRYVDLGATAWVLGIGLSRWIDLAYDDRPWEIEARFLEGSR